MSKYVKHNINQYVKVKVKEQGFELLVRQWNEFASEFEAIMPRTIEYFKSREDEEGYIKLQMHDFMDKFGNLGMSTAEYINTEILIEILE